MALQSFKSFENWSSFRDRLCDSWFLLVFVLQKLNRRPVFTSIISLRTNFRFFGCWNFLFPVLLANKILGNCNVEHLITGLIISYNYSIFEDSKKIMSFCIIIFFRFYAIQAVYLRLNGLTTRVLRPWYLCLRSYNSSSDCTSVNYVRPNTCACVYVIYIYNISCILNSIGDAASNKFSHCVVSDMSSSDNYSQHDGEMQPTFSLTLSYLLLSGVYKGT